MTRAPETSLVTGRCLGGLVLWLASLLFYLATGSPASAHPPESFMRLAEDEDSRPSALQVALARYGDGQGRTLHLVGAVHVADRGYFEDLQERFEHYDVVLYEMVGDPDGDSQQPVGLGMSLVGALQGGMQNALGLASQREEIDYERGNFRHADMTGPEFSDRMKRRDESWAGTFMKLWAASAVSREPATQQAQLLEVLFASNRQLALKRVMAESMVDQARVFELLADADGSVLITERNRKALSVLEREMDGGARNLALFYGAGHLPDFHRRLTDEFGFELRSVEWLNAWDLGGG